LPRIFGNFERNCRLVNESAIEYYFTGRGVDGLLGLDFLRGQRLEIDFVQGLVSLV
jgi:hypothetical protein